MTPGGKTRWALNSVVLTRLVTTFVVLLFLTAVVLLMWSGWDGWLAMTPVERARLAAGFLVLLLLTPVCQFLLYGWQARRTEVLALFPPKAILLYYEKYFPAEKKRYAEETAARIEAANGEDADNLRAAIKAEFKNHFDERYGRRHYVIPIGLLVLVSATLAFFCARFLFEHPPADVEMKAYLSDFTVILCLAGAYCWVLYDFFFRERSLDFSTTHVNWACFRLVISVPLAYAIPMIFPDQGRMAVAFLLGTFPTGQLMTLLRRRASQIPGAQNLGIGENVDDRLSKLETLPSVDTATADRFREEGITTIAQLGNADPVALTLRSGFPLSFIFDCISEAIAWYYLQKEGLDVTRTHSIPGALEVYGLIEELDYAPNDKDPRNQRYLEDRKLANEVINLVEGKLKCGRVVLERNLRCIWDDSRAEFLAQLMDATHFPSSGESAACHGGTSVARRAVALNERSIIQQPD
jgi:hypothetical protein